MVKYLLHRWHLCRWLPPLLFNPARTTGAVCAQCGQGGLVGSPCCACSVCFIPPFYSLPVIFDTPLQRECLSIQGETGTLVARQLSGHDYTLTTIVVPGKQPNGWGECFQTLGEAARLSC